MQRGLVVELRTLLCSGEDVEGVDCEQHQRRRKLVSQKPKLRAAGH
jgi:hypothetical protein